MTQQQPDLEARLLHIESRLAALELAREEQETRDIAILARIDGFIDDLRRIERVQMRSFDEIKIEQQELKSVVKAQAADIKSLQETQAQLIRIVERQEQNVAVLAETAKGHKVAIESLAESAKGHKVAIEGLAETAKDHKVAIEGLAGQVRELAVGQQQIITILTGGKPQTQD